MMMMMMIMMMMMMTNYFLNLFKEITVRENTKLKFN